MIWKNNLLSDLKRMYINELEKLFGIRESTNMLNLLISGFFGLSRVEQALQTDFRLTESEMLTIHNAVKELKKHKPVQYIIGETEFFELKIKVNEAVLIPRPETEELVRLIEKEEKKSNLRILDIGTGSGCIAIALAKKLNKPTVLAIDISQKAISLAAENALSNDVEIEFIEGDILSFDTNCMENIDIIVSNPPYVRRSEESLMESNIVDYEPHLALFVEDENALLFYKAIVGLADTKLHTKGRLYFEINESLAKEVCELLEEHSYYNIKVHQDINNKDRMVSAVNTNINPKLPI